MPRIGIVSNVVGALIVAALVTVVVVRDRSALLHQAEERTLSTARMIAAHGEAALGEAATVVRGVTDQTAAWDMRDEAAGRQLFDALRKLIANSTHISSAWILDADGLTLLDTWIFPPRPLSAAARTYFRKHVEGAPDPVIGGEAEGSTTGRRRFTYSQAIRDPDGSLDAVIVVGIYSSGFDTLYSEAARWPDARAGLYSFSGNVLARLRSSKRASPEFIEQVQRNVRETPSGSALIHEGAAPQIASWQRLSSYPDLYAISSQTISGALTEWRWRSGVFGVTAAIAVLGFSLFSWANLRALKARHRAELHELAIREVHHRVKNWLQLAVSMIRLRARRQDNPAVRTEMEHLQTQLRALAELQDILQNTTDLDRIDVRDLLKRLIDRLSYGDFGRIALLGTASPVVGPEIATPVAIIANELITNSLKHARGSVNVRLDADAAAISITVYDDGPGLPAPLDVEAGVGFGLKAASALASTAGGSLTADNAPRGGAVFRLVLPLEKGLAPAA